MNEQKIRRQNSQLRQEIQSSLEQIETLKQTNHQHESEIQTLLKFNQRLLTIIETQLNTHNSRRSERSLSLQPISQITEKDSQVAEGGLQIKLSTHNYRLNEIEGDKKDKKNGNETDRVMIGNTLEEKISHQAKSDYQREYSQYSQQQKFKEVINLIAVYRKEYGQSMLQCEEAKNKIEQEIVKSSQQIEQRNQKNQQFYVMKMSELEKLQNKLQNEGSERALQSIIKNNNYSVSTQNKLMKIMNSIKK